MPDWSDVDVPDLIDESAAQGAGSEYEYEGGFYLNMLQAQLAAMKQRWENYKEDKERTDPLSATNMGKINTALAFRGGVEAWRDKYIEDRIVKRGGITQMEDPNNPGSGLTIGGTPATFRFPEQTGKGQVLSAITGWGKNIETIDYDADGNQIVNKKEEKVNKNQKQKEVKEVKNEVVEKVQPSLHSKDGRKFRSYAKNPRTGEMDKYYTDDNGQKVFQKDYWLELQTEKEAAAAASSNQSSDNSENNFNQSSDNNENNLLSNNDGEDEIVLNGTLTNGEETLNFEDYGQNTSSEEDSDLLGNGIAETQDNIFKMHEKTHDTISMNMQNKTQDVAGRFPGKYDGSLNINQGEGGSFVVDMDNYLDGNQTAGMQFDSAEALNTFLKEYNTYEQNWG